MASGTCNLNCPQSLIPTRYDLTNCESELRNYGVDTFLLFHCSVDFSAAPIVEGEPVEVEGELNILNQNLWDAYFEAGLIIKSPCGALDFGDANDEIVLTTGCGVDKLDISEVPFTFETCEAPSDKSDEQWWFDFDKNIRDYTFGWVNCDSSCIYIGEEATAAFFDQNFSAISTPGFLVSITGRPAFVAGPGGRGRAGIWRFEGNINTKCVRRGITIPGLDLGAI